MSIRGVRRRHTAFVAGSARPCCKGLARTACTQPRGTGAGAPTFFTVPLEHPRQRPHRWRAVRIAAVCSCAPRRFRAGALRVRGPRPPAPVVVAALRRLAGASHYRDNAQPFPALLSALADEKVRPGGCPVSGVASPVAAAAACVAVRACRDVGSRVHHGHAQAARVPCACRAVGAVGG